MSTRVGRNPFEKRRATQQSRPASGPRQERGPLEKLAQALIQFPTVPMFLAYRAFQLIRSRVAKA